MFGKMCATVTLFFIVLLLAAVMLSGCAVQRAATGNLIPPSNAGWPYLPPDPAQVAPPPPPLQQPAVSTLSAFTVVLFDFDRYDIRPDQEFVMAQNVAPAQASKVIRLEGYCDERGSIEYNLALGQRRADAVRKALIRRGVTAEIRTVSFGKERATGKGEMGWAMDRKVEFARE